ncbi:hypothetical protein D3C83_199580 [compost metagenome]
MHLFDIRTDRNDRAFGVAFRDRTREIFLDRYKLAEINSAALINDPEAPDAEDILEAPFADDRPRR